MKHTKVEIKIGAGRVIRVATLFTVAMFVALPTDWSSMKHYGLTLCLEDDAEVIERYKEYHRNPWPGPLQGLRDVGIVDMQIFLLGTRMFMYMTTVDEFEPDVDFAKYIEANPKAKEWDDLMRTFQVKVAEAKEEEWWAMMEHVFDLGKHLPPEQD